MGMRGFASHILAVANARELDISNMQLQKIMFFVFGRMVKVRGVDSEIVRETYDMPFERWGYGPAVRSIYYDYNNFGGRPILDKDVHMMDEYSEFDDKIVHLLGVDPFRLVETTHRLPSWADYREDIYDRNFVPPYALEDFRREFCREY